MIQDLAPSRSLVATLAAEAGIALEGAGSSAADAIAIQLRAVEAGVRSLVDALIAHGSGLCEGFRDAADALMRAEIALAHAVRLDGARRAALVVQRAEWRGKAIAARAAADAALAASAMLACYVREELGVSPVSAAEPQQQLLFAAAG